ncbi:MAG: DUF1566 domain-containing protein [Saprospiraceae bacterium]
MLKYYIFLACFILFGSLSAQSPQKMSFQSVFRQSDGKLANDRNIGIKISVLQGNSSGKVVFAETHITKTNANGLASIEIGTGKALTASFSDIQWSKGPFYLQTEADLNGGNNYTLSGVQQLLSVPYALYAENGDKVVTLRGAGSTTVSGTYPNFTISSVSGSPYIAGPGISIASLAITNTAPDRTVNIKGNGSTTVSGIYPDFTINGAVYTAGAGIAVNGTEIINTAPDKVVSLKGTGTTTVSGNYPDFTINSSASTANYTAGSGIAVIGTEISNTAPDQTISLQGAGTTTVSGTYPNFMISSTGNAINYTAGNGIDINGSTISNNAPDKTVSINGTGATTVSGNYPNFTINSTDNNTVYNAGAGITINGTTISNAAPDKAVNLTAGSGISISGIYPDYTVSATGSAAKHYVGELFGGGIVYYIYDNGDHGLIASLTDISSNSIWFVGTSSANGKSYHDGLKNSNSVVSAQGTSIVYAARTCRAYSAGGFADWYLPSLWEMNLMYQNAFMISYKLLNDNISTTSPITENVSYWTSTEFDNSLAFMFYMATGTPYLDTKDKGYYVRAVRRF